MTAGDSPGGPAVPGDLTFRQATAGDLAAIVALLADDDLARERGGYPTAPQELAAAFAAIDADPRNELVVAEQDGTVVGTCQLTFIPGLSRGGTERMTVEAVRIRADRRGAGLGRRLMAYAVSRARQRGCTLVQLTTDKRRTDAHRFYESLGFAATHEGMKLPL